MLEAQTGDSSRSRSHSASKRATGAGFVAGVGRGRRRAAGARRWQAAAPPRAEGGRKADVAAGSSADGARCPETGMAGPAEVLEDARPMQGRVPRCPTLALPGSCVMGCRRHRRRRRRLARRGRGGRHRGDDERRDPRAPLAERGFKVVGEGRAADRARRRSRSASPAGERFDYVLLATQPPQVEEAARDARCPRSPTDGAMVVPPERPVRGADRRDRRRRARHRRDRRRGARRCPSPASTSGPRPAASRSAGSTARLDDAAAELADAARGDRPGRD